MKHDQQLQKAFAISLGIGFMPKILMRIVGMIRQVVFIFG